MAESTKTLTTSDGVDLFVRVWTVDEPRAVVVIAHGVAEHSGRYAHVAAALNEAGFTVVASDHRGHGQSGGERVYVTEFDQFVDDLKLLWDSTVALHPGLPMFLLGHSMGGLIAVRFALRYQAAIHGLITSGVGLLPGEGIPNIMIVLSKVLGKILPKLPLSGLDSADISRDPDVVADYDNDPLNYRGKLRAGFAAAFLLASEDALARVGELRLPILAMHGADDRLVPVETSRIIYRAAVTKEKALMVYPKLYHEIFNEPEQDIVLLDLISWLEWQLE